MSALYNNGKLRLTDGTIIWSSTTLKVMLVTSAYVFNADHSFVVSITTPASNELSGTGYVQGYGNAGRKTLANKVITRDDTNDLIKYTADASVWTGISAGTIAAAVVIYETGGSDATAIPVAYVNTVSGFPKVTTGADLTLTWPSTGLLQAL